MSRFLRILLITAASIAPLAASAQPSSFPSAVTTLRNFGRERGDAVLSRVVGVVGFNGQDQPAQWLLLQADAETPNLLHEYAVQGGRVVAHREFFRNPGQDLPNIPIAVSKLAIDSPQAFALANQAARKAGIGFDAMNYQLRCRDLRNEPIWVLSLMDGARRVVGVVYISALNGETLRTVWNQAGPLTTSAPPVAPPAPAASVMAPPAPQQQQRRESSSRGLIPQLADRISDRRSGGGGQARHLVDPATNPYATPGMPAR